MIVAQTIASQIGRRALFMMGASLLVADGNTLTFSIKGSRAVNKVRVTLEPSDTYRVDFLKIRGCDVRTVATVDGIYHDGLHQVIEAHTGLYLSL